MESLDSANLVNTEMCEKLKALQVCIPNHGAIIWVVHCACDILASYSLIFKCSVDHPPIPLAHTYGVPIIKG